jgi:hypothetical protein
LTIAEFIEQLEKFPDDAEIQIEFVSVSAGASYSAEPKVIKWGDKVLIVTGKRVK